MNEQHTPAKRQSRETSANNGAMTKTRMTYQQTGQKPVDVKWPDGRMVLAGDLPVGQEFTVDPKTGIITLIETAKQKSPD